MSILPPPDNALEVEKKMYKISVLLDKIPFSSIIHKFFDVESEKNLDKKIELLEKEVRRYKFLKEIHEKYSSFEEIKKICAEHEEYFEHLNQLIEILELYPGDDVIWD